MKNILSKLPAFEAAARHGSFVEAAQELHRSPAAISRQIRGLEEEIGLVLFERQHRRVSLSAEGAELLKSVELVMRLMDDALTALRPKPTGDAVRITTDLAFAHFWLLPRLGRLNTLVESSSFSVMASDSEGECLANRSDLPIAYGNGVWFGYKAHHLMDEVIFPVCSPTYLDTLGCPQAPGDLLRGTLLDVEGGPSTWVAWNEWLGHFSCRLSEDAERIAFSSLPWSIQLAQDGKGVALGWKYLVDPLIASGQLVRPIPHEMQTGRGYYVLEHQQSDYPDALKQAVSAILSIAKDPEKPVDP